jgi:hypothetical protein
MTRARVIKRQPLANSDSPKPRRSGIMRCRGRALEHDWVQRAGLAGAVAILIWRFGAKRTQRTHRRMGRRGRLCRQWHK